MIEREPTLIKASYSDILPFSRIGDVLAFSGRGPISLIIELFTWSRISHVGIIYDPVTLCEVTNLRGSRPQVAKRSIAEVLAGYSNGIIYYLPLASRYHDEETAQKLREWLDEIEEKEIKYDYWQAIRAGIITPLRSRESFGRLFCSEQVARSIEIKCKVDMNCSEVRPKDAIQFDVYEDWYYCIKGKSVRLKKINSVNPEGFRK